MWCAVGNFGVWEPYFFEEEDKAASVTSAHYVQMLQNFLKPNLQDLGKLQRYGFNKIEQLPAPKNFDRCFGRAFSSPFDFFCVVLLNGQYVRLIFYLAIIFCEVLLRYRCTSTDQQPMMD